MICEIKSQFNRREKKSRKHLTGDDSSLIIWNVKKSHARKENAKEVRTKNPHGGGEEVKRRKDDGGVPDWMWYITWGIMLAALAIQVKMLI